MPSNVYDKIFNEDIKNANSLQNKVESLLCKDYITNSENKEETFDEIIQSVSFIFIYFIRR